MSWPFDPAVDFMAGEKVEVTLNNGMMSGVLSLTPFVFKFEAATFGCSAFQFIDSGQLLGSSGSVRLDFGDVDADGGILSTNYEVFAFDVEALGCSAFIFTNEQSFSGTPDEDHFAALGDLDGDGDLDAVVVNRVGIPNTVWLNDESACVLCGDGDGDIDILDALRVAQITAGLFLPGPGDLAVCDVNRSGAVEVLDALWIAQYVWVFAFRFVCRGRGR